MSKLMNDLREFYGVNRRFTPREQDIMDLTKRLYKEIKTDRELKAVINFLRIKSPLTEPTEEVVDEPTPAECKPRKKAVFYADQKEEFLVLLDVNHAGKVIGELDRFSAMNPEPAYDAAKEYEEENAYPPILASICVPAKVPQEYYEVGVLAKNIASAIDKYNKITWASALVEPQNILGVQVHISGKHGRHGMVVAIEGTGNFVFEWREKGAENV